MKKDLPRGVELLHTALLNKGTAFTEKERDVLGLQGLLPSRVQTIQEQVDRVMGNYRKKSTDLERYIHLISLEDRNETLFYRVLIEHIEELMPIVYTPTVGKACQEYGHIYRRPRGIFLCRRHRGRIAEVLRNWPETDVRVIVVTDGERILGLGDLGANGMGIPVGKLSLYTACAGIHPSLTLPVTLDVGTNNESLLEDPLYIGDLERRMRGEEYASFLEEFVMAVQDVFPDAVIQFEDFATQNAFNLLKRYRDRVTSFNDDIQGTAAVTLAGLYSAAKVAGSKLTDQKILFLGAGAAAIGIGELIVGAMVADGMKEKDAKARLWFFDSKSLVVAARKDLASHKQGFAHDFTEIDDFLTAVKTLEPTAIIGVSGQPHMFSREIIETMTTLNERPIVFALSNPTSKAEVTAEDAYHWSRGRAIYASGSPFPAVEFEGKTFVPGQGNNAYVFPGVGLGLVASRARRVTDAMFFAAAKALARQVSDADLQKGCIYPSLRKIREVSAHIGAAVAEIAYDDELADGPRPSDMIAHVRKMMFHPDYENYA